MLLTIGMAAYENPTEVWFTVQALRLYQDLEDCELLVIDNSPNKGKIEKNIRDIKEASYLHYPNVYGTAQPRNKVFESAKGDFVICMDSHVLLWQESIAKLKWWLKDNWEEAKNLIHGPIVFSSLKNLCTNYIPEWRSEMWGIWPPVYSKQKDGQWLQKVKDQNNNLVGTKILPDKLFEIPMMGCGLMGCRKDSWLGFHEKCYGFGGVEGVIQEKYRKAGRKAVCLPWLRWVHYFGSEPSYPLRREEKVRNFVLGFQELGMDLQPLKDAFDETVVYEAISKIKEEEEECL